MGTAALRAQNDPEPTLRDLVVDAGRGDPRAEGELCRRFAPLVRSFARRRLHGDAVDEFTQDVMLLFIEAVRSGSMKEPERAGGFVLGVCRNLAHDRARMAERRAALWERYGEAASSYEPPQTSTYEVAHLEDCLSQLSARTRELVRLSFVECAADVAIASELETSESNVRVMRHRTLAALRECMSKQVSWEAVA